MSYTKIVAVGTEPAKLRFHYLTSELFNSLSLRTTYRSKMVRDGEGKSQLDDIAISQDEKDITNELLETGINKLGAKMFKIAQGVTNSIFSNTRIAVAAVVDRIATITTPPIAGGTGYIVGQILTLIGDGASGGTCTIEAVDASTGEVTTVALASGGSGYSVDPAGIPTTVNTGSGTGCTVAVASIESVAESNVFSAGNESSGFELVDNAAYNTNLLPSIDKEIKNCLREFCLKEWYNIVGIIDDYKIHSLAYTDSLKEIENLTFQLRKPLMS